MKFELLTGRQAYLIWHIYNDCQIKINTLEDFDRNLELIVSEEGVILAFRFDHPSEFEGLVKDDGRWVFTNNMIEYSVFDQNRIRLICRNFAMN